MKTGKITALVCMAGFVLTGTVSCVSMKTYRRTIKKKKKLLNQ